MKKIVLTLLVLVLSLLFLFPRSVELINGNPVFGFDQGREYLAVYNILVNHKFILIGTELGAGSAGINGLFHGPIYYYLLTIPFILFNGDPAGGTYLIFFFNLTAAVFLFYFVRKIFGLWPAVLAAFIMAVSPIFISQARFLWSPNPPAFFILLSLYFTYLLRKKSSLIIFLSAFFAAFVYNFEMGTAIPLCIALLIYSVYIFGKDIKKYLFLFSGFIVGFLPMILFEIRHNFLGLNGLITYLLGDKSQNSYETRFIADHFNAIVYNFNNTFGLEQILPVSLFYIPSIIILGLIIYFFKKEKNRDFKNLVIYFFILVVTTFVVFLPLQNALYGYYLTDLSLFYIILFAYIVFSAYKNKEWRIFYPLIIFAVLLVAYSIPQQFKTTRQDLADYGGTAKLKGKVDAIDYIYKDANGKPFNLLVFSPPVYTYPYDYLIQWHGKTKYNYVPGQEKEGTFYLLIEPDPQKPWSYKGWLETVIKDGKIIKTQMLPSGFIVQKRTFE